MNVGNEVNLEKANADPAAPTDLATRPSKLKQARGILIAMAVAAFVAWAVARSQPRPTMLTSGGLWVVYNVIISLALRKRPDAKSAESMKSRAVHEQLVLAGLVLLFAPIPGLRGRFVPDTLTTAAIGLGIQLASMLFYFWSRSYLGRLWSGQITIMKGHHLVETGPYRLLRHPIYTGFIGMFVGTAIVSGQYHALVGIAVCIIAYARKIPMEEAALRAEFGEAFDAYRQKRWAFIPWVY